MIQSKLETRNWKLETNSNDKIRISSFEFASYFELRVSNLHHSLRIQEGSTFVIVLWIAFGLVSMALYFGQLDEYGVPGLG